MLKLPKITSLQNLCDIVRKKWVMKLDFCVHKHQSFLNYAESFQYLNKEVSYEVDVMHADKHESLLQVDAIIFEGVG